ncbi:MAG: DUF177 domain-containing protein [bacterium]|nr:DUF177 domain-containing protein [bacterium]
MLINLSEVLAEPHKTIVQDVTSETKSVRIGGKEFDINEISPVHLKVEYTGEKKIRITGNVSLKVTIPCDRCLEDVLTELDLDIEKNVNLNVDCDADEDDSDEANYIDGYHLDVEQLLYNEILVGWPMKVLCSEDCKGICSVCGQNLNQGSCDCEDTSLDPRMSVIRDLYKNFKEV